MSNAHGFISAFPDGYQTEIAGAQLSGGQKQRVAIARTLMKHPAILLLDEATSALDSESELIVQRALDSLLEKSSRTTIIIGEVLSCLHASATKLFVVCLALIITFFWFSHLLCLLCTAHRLSTIRNADMIVYVKDGKVMETGSHDELMARPDSLYKALVETGETKASEEAEIAEDVAKLESNGASSTSAMDSAVARVSDFSQASVNVDSLRLSSLASSASVECSNNEVMLKMRNVTFAYPKRPDNVVFKGLNLDIYRGETVALVGPSGQGKSTIVGLIERFYDPAGGSVELLGNNLTDINVRYLRDQIGLVEQEPTLFAMSIGDNIAYGLPGASREEIIEAAKLANAHTFISSFPKGYDTNVGQRGSQLSGGQVSRGATVLDIDRFGLFSEMMVLTFHYLFFDFRNKEWPLLEPFSKSPKLFCLTRQLVHLMLNHKMSFKTL